jgi:DNA repair exonuclease SbcCD nuclease subunit
MKFQYMSDLHLEFYDQFEWQLFHAVGDILLLAGDIGNPFESSYKIFITKMSLAFEHVYVVTGNHEYYSVSSTMNETDAKCREICRTVPRDNVTFLQNESKSVADGIMIFGGTFWSHIPARNYLLVKNRISDYTRIPKFTPRTSNDLHEMSTKSLYNELNKYDSDMKWIVLSHHMPSFDLIDPKYGTSAINCAFASEIPVAKDERIKAWVYGHTHTSLQKGKYYCNPIGYPGENNDVNLEKYFEFEKSTSK